MAVSTPFRRDHRGTLEADGGRRSSSGWHVGAAPMGQDPVGSIVVEGGYCYLQIMSGDVPSFVAGAPIGEQMAAAVQLLHLVYGAVHGRRGRWKGDAEGRPRGVPITSARRRSVSSASRMARCSLARRRTPRAGGGRPYAPLDVGPRTVVARPLVRPRRVCRTARPTKGRTTQHECDSDRQGRAARLPARQVRQPSRPGGRRHRHRARPSR